MPVLYRGYGSTVLAKYPLDAPVVVLGREADCDITLKGDGVSRRHCQFVRSGDAYCVEDLGSANGVYVNRTKVQVRRLLQDGDRIAVMGHILTYRAQGDVVDNVPKDVAGEAESDYPPTQRVDPDELLRRLEKLFDHPGRPMGDDDEQLGENRPAGDGDA